MAAEQEVLITLLLMQIETLFQSQNEMKKANCTGWPKKVSHYQQSSLNHILKIASSAIFLINF